MTGHDRRHWSFIEDGYLQGSEITDFFTVCVLPGTILVPTMTRVPMHLLLSGLT